jgi:hypothetical protein
MDVVTRHPIVSTEMIDPHGPLDITEQWFTTSELLCRPAILSAERAAESRNHSVAYVSA